MVKKELCLLSVEYTCSPLLLFSNQIGLRDHYRSHDDIIQFSNRFFYEKKLRIATRYKALCRPYPPSPGVRWIDVSGEVQRPSEGGAYNLIEAQGVVREVHRLLVECRYQGTVGVVTPFHEQAAKIEKLVRENSELINYLEKSKFLCGTAHTFQGNERDVIFFSPVVAKGIKQGTLNWLNKNGNLFNVAITRARAHLCVVGDKTAARESGVTYLKEFANHVDRIDHPEKATSRNFPDIQWEKILAEALLKEGIKTISSYQEDPYPLDLAIIDGNRRLDIEADSKMHHKSWDDELCRHNQIRNQRLYELDWDVMRFWNYEIQDDLPRCIEKVKVWLKSNKR